jgi:hypothetical protein
MKNQHARRVALFFPLLSFALSGGEPARLVPDTLDLRANAKLSLNFLQGTMDMHQRGVPYFTIYYGADPVALSHKVYDLDENPGRWLHAFVAAREVCGSVEGKVTMKINGQEHPLVWEGAYLVVKERRLGDRIVVDYPMRVVTLTDTIKGKGVFRTKWKGNTVVSIDPPGEIYPLFQREHLLSDHCPMKRERILERGARVENPVDEIDW